MIILGCNMKKLHMSALSTDLSSSACPSCSPHGISSIACTIQVARVSKAMVSSNSFVSYGHVHQGHLIHSDGF